MNQPQQQQSLQPPQQSESGSNYNSRNNGHGEKINLETMSHPAGSNNIIFSHKDGGIMEDTYGNQLQQQRQK